MKMKIFYIRLDIKKIFIWNLKSNNIKIKENITEEYYEFENFSDCAYLKLIWDNGFAEKWYTEYADVDPRQLPIPFNYNQEK